MNSAPQGIASAPWPKGWVPPAPEPGGRGMRVVLGYLLAALVAIPFLRYITLPDVPLEQQVLAYILFCICTYPVLTHFRKKEPGLPVFPIICLVYAVTYSVPVYFSEPIMSAATYTGWVRVAPADTTTAVKFCIIGVLSMQFGFWFFRFSMLSLMVPRVRLQLNAHRAKPLMTSAGLGGVIILWLWMSGRIVLPGFLMSIMMIVSHLPTLCAAYLYWMYLHGQIEGYWRTALLVIVLISVSIGLSMGNTRNAIDVLVTIGAVHWMVRRKIEWKYLILGLTFFVAIQSVKGEYRRLVWKHGEAGNNIVARLKIWQQLLTMSYNQYAHRRQSGPAVNMRMSFGRADMIHLFGLAVHKTGRFVPFQHGKTYDYFLYAWIPRMFWKDKPTAQAANQFFGVAYGLQEADTIGTTSIGLPHIVEAYINFGRQGLVFIMIMMGMFYATLDRLFNHQEAGGGGIALYSTLMMNFVNIETSTAATFGALPQTILILYVALRILRERRKRLT